MRLPSEKLGEHWCAGIEGCRVLNPKQATETDHQISGVEECVNHWRRGEYRKYKPMLGMVGTR